MSMAPGVSTRIFWSSDTTSVVWSGNRIARQDQRGPLSDLGPETEAGGGASVSWHSQLSRMHPIMHQPRLRPECQSLVQAAKVNHTIDFRQLDDGMHALQQHVMPDLVQAA